MNSIFETHCLNKEVILISNEKDQPPVKAKIIGFDFPCASRSSPAFVFESQDGKRIRFFGATYLFNQKFFDFICSLTHQERYDFIYKEMVWKADLNYFLNASAQT
jgi:hypothetical protein